MPPDVPIPIPTKPWCFQVALGDSPVLGLHTHTSHEFFLCVRGTGTQYTPGRRFPMKEGDLFFFPTGQQHYANRPPDGECVGLVLNLAVQSFLSNVGENSVSRAILQRLEREGWEDRNLIAVSPDGRTRLEQILRDIITELQQRQAGHDCAVRLKLEALFLTMLRDKRAAAWHGGLFAASPTDGRLDGVYHYVQTHYMHPIFVEQMAELACVSRSHFHAVFRAETGMTLVQYVNKIRTRAARELLRSGELTISEVALRCGYPNLSHFYHVFKAATGVTPKAYARQASGSAKM